MARQTKEEKRIEAAVESAFNRLGNNIQFNIMDLGKIFNDGVAAVRAELDLDAAMLASIAKYRQN